MCRSCENFAELRADYCFEHVLETFPEAEAIAQVSLAVDPPEAGALHFSTLHFDTAQLPWQGRYFQGIPIPVKAIAKPGWSFSGWSEPALGTSDSITLLLTAHLNLTAFFTQDSMPTSGTDTSTAYFQISPNPANSAVHIESAIPVRKVVLYNTLGVKQLEFTYEPSGVTTTLLHLNELPAGVYWLEACFETGGKIVRRLVKN